MSSNVLSLLGWSFLPNLATNWLQSFYYSVTIRAGAPRPQPGTKRFITHRKRIHILVISLYLLYTIIEADWEIRRASDFYQDLGVAHDATDREIKSRFRRLAALHHPDKVTTPGANDYFVHLKLAQDTLLDPAKRFAYDRLGPTITGWKNRATVREYATQGLQMTLLYYVGSAVVLAVFGVLGVMPFGSFWRWVTLLAVAILEFQVVASRSAPGLATKIVNPVLTTLSSHPPYLPFQLIQLARKTAITVNIALSQIGPWVVQGTPGAGAADQSTAVGQQMDRLEMVTRAVHNEASRLMAMEMAPFAGDGPTIRDVQGKVKGWLVQNTIRSDPEVRDAMGRTLRKRRR